MDFKSYIMKHTSGKDTKSTHKGGNAKLVLDTSIIDDIIFDSSTSSLTTVGGGLVFTNKKNVVKGTTLKQVLKQLVSTIIK